MDADLFLQQFGHLAQGEGGIKKLRDVILQLAVRGKLVEQNPADEPAEILLNKIEAERKRLLKEGAIKKQRGNSISQNQDVPYTLPRNWKWVELTEVTIMITDGSHNPPPKQPVGIPMLSGQNIKKGLINFEASRLITEEDYIQEIKRTPIQQGDVFLSIVGTIGESAVVPECFPRVALQRSIALVKTLINPFYLSKVFSSPMAFSYYNKHAKGTAQKGIYLGKLSEFLVPLPPLAEQKRIVAKVDELMALCDKLEAEHKIQRALKTQSLQSTLHHLTSAEKPASELLKRIEAEKKRLVKEGFLKKPKLLSFIAKDDQPFAIPESWEWIKFGSLADFINGDRGKNYPNKSEYVATGVTWINTGHIEPDGTLSVQDMNYITRQKFDSLRGGKIQQDDLVYCLRGATFGKTAFVKPYNEGAIASSLMIIRPYLASINQYIYFYLTSPLGRSQIFRFDNGSAQPNLSANSVTLYAFPLPPLAEQKLIVAKVDELMTLCDQLEAHITQTKTLNTHLMDSLIHRMTETV